MRQPSNLSESLHRQLNSYALAASAAGVSILALVQPCAAKIVYTKAHRYINGWPYVTIDFNHDGTKDFIFKRYSSMRYTSWLDIEAVGKIGKNHIWGSRGSASALPSNFQVGSNSHFASKTALMWRQQSCTSYETNCTTAYTTGQWGPQNKNPYLGLQFKINGKTHYGWARVILQTRRSPKKHGAYVGDFILTGYAYETVVNKPIITGKTKGPDVITLQDPSLGHLARGASAIPAWRGKGNQ